MNASKEQLYLQQVLQPDTLADPRSIMRQRRQFLQPSDVVLADLAQDQHETDDFAARMQHQLNSLRRDFWTLDPDELNRRIEFLCHVGHAETAASAARLRNVAEQRSELQRLASNETLHYAFIKSLMAILIAPASEANRMREQELSWMRPEQNAQYREATRAIQQATSAISKEYPGVFLLEEAWLTELIEYDPAEEKDTTSGKSLLGLALIVTILMTIWAIGGVIRWIFS